MRTRTGQELGWFPLLGPSDGLFGGPRRRAERRHDQPRVVEPERAPIEGSTMVFKGLSVMVAGHVVTVEIDEDAREGRMVLTRPKDGRIPTAVEMEALAFSVSKLWLRATRVHPDKFITPLTAEQLADRRQE